MEAHVKYLSSGVNHTPLCFDWSSDGTVCYAADTGIVLYEPKSGVVTGASTKVHTKRIISVRWVQPAPSSRRMVVSTGADGKAVVWKVSQNKEEDFYALQPSAVLDHDDLVLLADAAVVNRESEERILVVTATTGVLKTWLVCPSTGKFECLNTCAPPSHIYLMSLRLYEVSGARYPVMFCGGHDCKIYILTCSEVGQYQSACTLLGHEDWITALNLVTEDTGNILLASGSKDSTVRIWKLSHPRFDSREQQSRSDNKELKLKSLTFRVPNGSKESTISVLLEAVLAGHEGMVSEVYWAHPTFTDGKRHQPYKLLTCSKTQDRSIMIWQPQGTFGNREIDNNVGDHGVGDGGDVVSSNHACKAGDDAKNGSNTINGSDDINTSKTVDTTEESETCVDNDNVEGGLWVEVARLGEVGGNMEGYYTCQFGPGASHVLACNYQGGLHLWRDERGSWEPCVVVGGHFHQVADITWDPLGRYLLSTSKDQTTRLHAPWLKQDGKSVWHEVGRPQVHGYDMTCITSLGRYTFTSGADEKVIRGFTAPANFIRNFGRICGLDVEDDLGGCSGGEGATVPSLGLSNKAVMATDLQEERRAKQERGEEVQAYFTPLHLSGPPTEDQLMQNTLWPEAAKLYGHGNELITLAATSDGRVLASASRAANNMDAHIILWDSSSWQKVDSLGHHRLTVTHLSFSPDDLFLLAVSRDRSWSLYARENTQQPGLGYTYKLVDFSQHKATLHSRVIWKCTWLPDSSHFLTASRDKTVGVWGQESQGEKQGWWRKALLIETNEVTAVAITTPPGLQTEEDFVIIATGLVCGSINVRKFYPKTRVFTEEVLGIFHHHQDTVRSISFRPQTSPDSNTLMLASCGNDKRVMLFEIRVK